MQQSIEDRQILSRDRNIVAALLSIIPGLGHLYKGHYAMGVILMLLVTPFAIWAGVLLSLATAGVGLIAVLVIYWGGVGLDAFYKPDRRRHFKGIV